MTDNRGFYPGFVYGNVFVMIVSHANTYTRYFSNNKILYDFEFKISLF